ncbi:MAG: GGDEF domain-containing protein [Thermodesulfobacteriota bacterium]
MDGAPEGYIGRILPGEYGERLKNRLRGCIDLGRRIDGLMPRVYPYISAWKDNDRVIWYEFVGQRLAALFGCASAGVADAFARALIDRRSYKYIEVEPAIREEVITRQELGTVRDDLREEAKQTGMVEAVYRLELADGRSIWLKDWAQTEYFAEDDIYLSCGTLTDVTKEMDHKSLLEQIGYFDELTRLPKRSIMHRILEINIGQVQRGHLQDFVFLMMDIDHFKRINDTYGHQAGDHILSTMAEVMASVKRKEDEIGRYAGEEFYGISHGGIHNGSRFAERLRGILEQTVFTWKGERIPVTVSIGVVSAGQLAQLSVEKLIAVADRRLYAAKEQGRNRVIAEGCEEE